MFGLILVLFIIQCLSFCYFHYKILEIEKDLDVLYNSNDEVQKVVHKIIHKVVF